MNDEIEVQDQVEAEVAVEQDTSAGEQQDAGDEGEIVLAKSPRRFTPEEIKAIREMRAIPRDDNPARPKHGHAEIAEKFGRSGQQISNIVRNISHVDPEYTPVFDGFLNRPRDENGNVIKKVKPEPVLDEAGEVVKPKRGRKKKEAEVQTEESTGTEPEVANG